MPMWPFVLCLFWACSAAAEPVPTGNWVVRLNPQAGSAGSVFLEGLGVEVLGPVGELSGAYVVRPRNAAAIDALRHWDVRAVSARERRLDRLAARRAKEEGVDFPILWTEPELAAPAVAMAAPEVVFTDPLYPDQWHLNNNGQSGGVRGEDTNVVTAWLGGYLGDGIVIGVLDEGVESSHEDISLNYRSALSYDFIGDDNNPTPETDNETHGNAVAGVAAARDNGRGGVGVAPRAGLASLRILDDILGGSLSSSQVGSALTHEQQAIDVYNNSWGYGSSGGGYANVTRSQTVQDALRQGAQQGRAGKGNIYVWSAGNDAGSGDNVNYDNMVNSIYTLAIGSVGDRGVWASYSNPGAALNLVAPSNGNVAGITTVDREGSLGADPGNYRDDFGGTSSASPVVSGTVALMLEANPNLNWRDVQHILHRTAIRVDPGDEDWVRNGAGLYVNHKYGFGRVDTTAAVRVSETWPGVGPAVQRDSAVGNSGEAIPDTAGQSVENTIAFNEDLRLEHVVITVSISHNRWSDLEIVLSSPAGTESVLAESRNASTSNPEDGFWEFSSVRHWGENARGNWTLRVRDRIGGSTGIFNNWQITFRGTALESDSNRAPDAAVDETITLENQVDVNVIANDNDSDGDALELISVYRPSQGDAYLLDENTLRLEPPVGFRGLMPITYTVTDNQGGVAFGTLNFINPLPDAKDDRTGALPGKPVFLFPLDNDINADNDLLTLDTIGPSVNGGTLEVYGKNFVRYQAPEGFSGLDTFQYVITDATGEGDQAEISVVVPESGDFAYEFDGEDSAVEIPDSDSLNLSGPLTLEAWIYPTGWGEAATGFGRIFDKESYLLFLNSTESPFYPDNSLVFYLRQSNGNASAYTTPAFSIALNRWTHVAATYDGGNQVRFYINGNPVNALLPTDENGVFDPLVGPLQDSSDFSLHLGENSERSRAFSGRIDEARVWNRVRTAAEVAADFERTLDGMPPGLVGYWPMIEGRGDRIRDFSGNGNMGTGFDTLWAEGRVPGLARGEAWDTALDLGDGWRFSDWFGLFFEDAEPWIYHSKHQWLFQIADTDDSILFYDPAFEDWLWTGRTIFPYFYRLRAGHWVFFNATSENPRYFYNYESGEWEAR